MNHCPQEVFGTPSQTAGTSRSYWKGVLALCPDAADHERGDAGGSRRGSNDDLGERARVDGGAGAADADTWRDEVGPSDGDDGAAHGEAVVRTQRRDRGGWIRGAGRVAEGGKWQESADEDDRCHPVPSHDAARSRGMQLGADEWETVDRATRATRLRFHCAHKVSRWLLTRLNQVTWVSEPRTGVVLRIAKRRHWPPLMHRRCNRTT